MSGQRPPEPPALPSEPTRGELTRLRLRERRWRTIALASLAVLLLWAAGLLLANDPTVPAEASGAAAAVQAADNPDSAQYKSEQAKAEIRLLRQALDAAQQVNQHHRHHSQVMWDLLEGKISSREAWWRGGDSTCAGWLAAGEFEEAMGKLKGSEVKPPPIPKRGLVFCKAARERK